MRGASNGSEVLWGWKTLLAVQTTITKFWKLQSSGTKQVMADLVDPKMLNLQLAMGKVEKQPNLHCKNPQKPQALTALDTSGTGAGMRRT